MVAYVLAWIPFRGSALVFIAVVSLQVLPIQMALLPLLVMFSNGWSMGPIPVFPNLDEPGSTNSALMGTYVPLWLAHTAFALPLAVFIMHNFIVRLPREVFDAARVDGAAQRTLARRQGNDVGDGAGDIQGVGRASTTGAQRAPDQLGIGGLARFVRAREQG